MFFETPSCQGPRRLVPMAFLLIVGLAGVAGCGGSESEAPRGRPTRGPVATPTPTVPAGPVAVVDVEDKLRRNVLIIFDGSGSMGKKTCSGRFDNKLDAATWAVATFLDSPSFVPEDHVGLLVFDRRGMAIRSGFDDGRPHLLEQLQRIRAGGRTPLVKALREGTALLDRRYAQQSGYGDYILVVVTDGAATDDKPPGSLAKAVRLAGEKGYMVATIGFCLGADHALRRDSYSYRNAQSPDELLTALEDVLAEDEAFDLIGFEGPSGAGQ